MRYGAFILMLALLAGCSAPTVPDITYFQLPANRVSIVHAEQATFSLPIVVDSFTADGIYSEQALLYVPAAEPTSLRAYHYQLWSDPPARLLQRRLIDQLNAAHVSDLVSDRLTSNIDALHVSTLIRGFERTQEGGRARCLVRLQIRVDRSQLNTPLLIKDYGAEGVSEKDDIASTVQCLGAAVDEIFAGFIDDMRKLRVD